MKSRIVTLFAAAIVLALGACASLTPTEPFAVIDGTDWDRTDPYAAPVQIASIDGKDYLRLSHRALPPGPHKIGFLTTQVLRYLNRLSDYLFVLARAINAGGAGDVQWVPGANR